MIPHLSHSYSESPQRLDGKFMPHLFCIVRDSRYLRGHQHIPFTNMRQQERLQFVGIIPARYASTRFPGKPLATLAGKPVIEHVYRRVVEALGSAYVATDDDRIAQAVECFGAFITTRQIETLCHCFDDEQTQIATLGKPFESMEAVENPNSPKIVTDLKGFALYFSRSVIPYVRGFEQTDWLGHFPYLKHLGIYAYRTEVLREITQLPQSPLEKAESLEQLRWLQAGYRIKVGITNEETVGIDTPEDLVRAERFLNERA